MSAESSPAELSDHPVGNDPLPAFVDWLLGILVVLAGMLAIIGGSAVAFLIDQELIVAEMEAEGARAMVGTRELTQAETLVLMEAILTWTGIGIVLVGVGMVVFAVAYLLARHRAHRRARAGEVISSYATFALLGAAVTVVLSFVPLSPALGGVVSGYLERGESTRTVSVGALAGVLPVLPIGAAIVFVLGGVVVGLAAIGEVGVAIVIASTMVFSALLLATVGAGLGAIGGFAGGWFAERQSRS